MKTAKIHRGVFWYKITGENADHAAAELEQKIESIERAYATYPVPGAYMMNEIDDAINLICKKYSVALSTE